MKSVRHVDEISEILRAFEIRLDEDVRSWQNPNVEDRMLKCTTFYILYTQVAS